MYRKENSKSSKSEKNLLQHISLDPIEKHKEILLGLSVLTVKKKRVTNKLFWCLLTFGQEIYTKQKTIARWCFCSVKTVQRTIDDLVACGVLFKDFRLMTSCIYTFNSILLERPFQKLLAKSFRAFRFLTEDEWLDLPIYTEIPEKKKEQNVVLLKGVILNKTITYTKDNQKNQRYPLTILKLLDILKNQRVQGEIVKRGIRQLTSPMSTLTTDLGVDNFDYGKENDLTFIQNTLFQQGLIMKHNPEDIKPYFLELEQRYRKIFHRGFDEKEAAVVVSFPLDVIDYALGKIEHAKAKNQDISNWFGYFKNIMQNKLAEKRADEYKRSAENNALEMGSMPINSFGSGDQHQKRTLKEQIAFLKEEEKSAKKSYSENINYKKDLINPFKARQIDATFEGMIRKCVLEDPAWQEYERLIHENPFTADLLKCFNIQELTKATKFAQEHWNDFPEEARERAQQEAYRQLHIMRPCPSTATKQWIAVEDKMQDIKDYRVWIKENDKSDYTMGR